MARFRHREEEIAGLRQPDPAGAAEPFPGPESNPFAGLPGHDFSDASRDPRRLFRREANIFNVIPLKELTVIEQDNGLRFALDEDGEIRARNEEMLSDPQH